MINNKNIKDHNDIKIKLKHLLDKSCSNQKHKENILKLNTLKDVYIYCKINNLSGHFTNPII